MGGGKEGERKRGRERGGRKRGWEEKEGEEGDQVWFFPSDDSEENQTGAH